MRRWVWCSALLLAGCGRNNVGFSALQELTGVFGVPNQDDDDGDSRRDFRQAGVDGENDLAPLVLAGLADEMRRNDILELTLGGATSEIRVWTDGSVLLDRETLSAQFDRDSVPAELGVEFQNFLTDGSLMVTLRDQRGEVVEEASLRLLASPLILNHHLQPVERSYVVVGEEGASFQYYGQRVSLDNTSMVDDMQAALGATLSAPSMERYQFDPWVQDEFETAMMFSPSSRIDLVIDSIRNRGLDPFPERVVAGDNSIVRTFGEGAYPTSQDSFGNLEVSPPVTVDGVHYPFGRIYWGSWGPVRGLVDELAVALRDTTVQDPFVLDASFLCVGHVDEFMTFIPDPTAPKGFRMLVADTDLGFSFLEGLDSERSLPRYDRDHGYATVGEIVGDRALRSFNEDVQRDGIDPNIDTLRRELGLDDEDIVAIPAIFEEVDCYGPRAGSLIPGTVNMLVVTGDDGESTLILPDSFLRDDGAPQADDPLIAYVNDLLPAAATPVWVDNWDVYHLGLGEVHCGTNTTRAPAAQWWTDALHLIDGDDQ